MKKSKTGLYYGALLLVFTIWGSLYVVSKYALGKIPAFTLIFLRSLVASAALLAYLRLRGIGTKVAKEDRRYFLLAGAGGYFLSVGLQTLGTKYASSAMASLLNALNPLTISVMSVLILKEKLTLRKVLGILVAVGLSLLLSKTVFKGDAMMYVMELPSYRVPALRDVCRHMWINAAEFVKKAFTIIFVGTVVIWFMQNFDTSFNPVSDASSSILAAIGTWMAPVLAPIGLDSWQATTGLLAGLAAKEAIVSTLAVLTGGAGAAALSSVFTPLTAYVFLVFILLYVPCLATFATTRKELGSTWQALLCVCMQILIAYLVCFAIYRVGLLFF